MFNKGIKKIGLLCIPFLFLLSSATENPTEIFLPVCMWRGALIAYKDRNYTISMLLFHGLRQNYPKTRYAEMGHFGMIKTHIACREFRQAKKELAAFRQTYPETQFFEQVLCIHNELQASNTGRPTWSDISIMLAGLFTLEAGGSFLIGLLSNDGLSAPYVYS